MEDQQELTPLFKIFRTIWTNRKFLIIFNIIVFILSIIILFLIPNKYKSSALLAFEEKKVSLPIPSMLKNLPLGLEIQGAQQIDKYIRLGQSRRVLDTIITKYNLDKFYKAKYREDTYKTVIENLGLIDNGDATFSVSYICKDKELASKVALEACQQIKRLDIELSVMQAKAFREFVEKRTQEAMHNLKIFEDSLKVFSEKTGVVEVEEQVKKSIQFLIELESKKLEIEVQRDFLKNKMGLDAGAYRQLEEQLKVLNNKIKDIYSSNSYSTMPIDSIPKQAMQYLRLYRNVKIQESVLEFLIPQVENARIEEKKNYSALVIIDRPVPAERKDGPKRAKNLITVMFITFIISVIISRFKELYYLNRNQIRSILNQQ